MPIITLRLKSVLKIAFALIFIALLMLNPETVSVAAKEGLNASLYLVMPSVFPFAVISTYICSNLSLPKPLTMLFSKVFKISEEGTAPFIMGLISGYPVGAILISDACSKKVLSRQEGEHLLPFSNAAGPLFMIGVLGVGMFRSVTIGYFLYAIHVISVVFICFIARGFAPEKSCKGSVRNSGISLVRSIDRAMNSMINVIGCITFFSVLCAVLKTTGIFQVFGSFSAVPYGITELTCGLKELSLSAIPMRLKLSIASFLCGFSGICIFLQVKNAVKEENLSCVKYVFSKLCIAVFAFILTWVLYPYLPVTLPTFTHTLPLSYDFVSGSYGFILILLPLLKFVRRTAPFFDKR